LNQLCQIAVIGATHIDRTGCLDNPSVLESSNPGHFAEGPGGTGFNVCGVVAALGMKPHLLSLVGPDAAGQWLRKDIADRGITLHVCGRTKENTGTYTSIIEPEGSLVIALADMAIYRDFHAADAINIVEPLLANDWICVDTNLPVPAIKEILAASGAQKIGLTVSKAKARLLHKFADELDLVFTNKVEACALCNIDEASDDQTMVAALRAIGLNQVVISNGQKNVIVVEAETVSSLPVKVVEKVVDVTGAGDALVGAALVALMKGNCLIDAVKVGIHAARATIQLKGSIRPDLATLMEPFMSSKSK